MTQAQAIKDTAAGSDEVLYDVADHIATITFNRPERMNTISREMLGELSVALLTADADPDVRVVILTGTGRAFCAGLDLTAATSGSGIGSEGTMSPTLDLKTAPPTVLFNMDTPTICALNGSAAGYGMDTALGCDIRIMAAGAKMAAAFTKRGIVPESGGTWFLPRLLGWEKAAELIFTGRTLTAAQCLEMGLIAEVAPDAELQARARAVATEIAANAPLAVQAMRATLRQGLADAVRAQMAHELAEQTLQRATADFAEGVRAVAERRPGRFTGN